jgi:F-box-like
MVRGNWQKRVETTDARRMESKQRKQKSEEKRHYKQWVQAFQDSLDRNHDRLHSEKEVLKIQLWTDTLPALPADEHEYVEDDMSDDIEGRKKRSMSLGGNATEKGRKAKARGRSNSTVDAPSLAKKKVHPRSKESLLEEPSVDLPPLWMCRSFFFTGNCDQLASRGGGRKSGGCRYMHSSDSKRDPTLWHVLSNSKRQADASRNLERAEKAEQKAAAELAAVISSSGHIGAMEMVFYMESSLDLKCDQDGPVSNQITELILSKNLHLASIVYIVLDEVLVFDRFRDGSIYSSDRDFLIAVLGEHAVGSRRDSVGNDGEASVVEAAAALRNIPGTVLEHILTFLPDRAVADASRVCKAWHHEIGKNSPDLWKHMIDRRGWPHPSHNSLDHHEYREEFRKHYMVIRDMKAIQKGLYAILDPRKTAVPEREMAYQDFSTRKHAPSYPNCCVGLQEWSPNRLLVAYHHDCSLRLFETVAKPGTCGEKLCREIICQRVDPYRNTKKRHCRIVSIGLDKECVASLCHVTGHSSIDAEAYVLVVISRDDFLLGESSGAADTAGGLSEDVSNLNVIDVGEAVLNYLLSSDVGDHRLLQLIDFLSQGGDVGEVEVLASQTLAACGYGRFMVEVSISIPMEDEDGTKSLHLIDRKLFLFSATIGAIVWAGESNPLPQELRPRREEMSISYLLRPHFEGGTRAACFFAVGSATSPAILMGEIEPSGEIKSANLLNSSLMARNDIVDEGWELFASGHRPILVASTDVVAADVLVRRDDEAVRERKSIISFYPRYPLSPDEPSYAVLIVQGNLEVVRLACIRDHYVVLVCREFCSPMPRTGDNEDRILGAIEGHWFGGNDEARDLPTEGNTSEAIRSIKVTAVIVHIESRREIGRICLLDGQTADSLVPHMVVDGKETIGLGLSWEGVVMTGTDVRSSMMTMLDDAQTRSSKKKKKRAPTKGGKKDGFARGMSLRG